MSGDLEKAGVAAATKDTQQYGATEVSKDGEQKLPLVLGRWEVAPNTLYKGALSIFIATFVIYRLADIVYIITVDARFPKGLNHYYPNEDERLASVSYTRQVLLCGLLHRCCVFSAVLAMVLLGLFARFDAVLREFIFVTIPTWWEASKVRDVWNACCSPFSACYGSCSTGRLCGPCFTWCGKVRQGVLMTQISERFGSPRSGRELLFGSLYLTLIGACFFVISAPFVYWSTLLDIKFGFANALAVSAAGVREELWSGLISALIMGIPTKFLYLAVLQYRLGWLFMWIGLIIAVIWAQFNIQSIAPTLLDMNNPFPSEIFAVGRGFPWVHTQQKTTPWVSLNRIYFKDPSLSSSSVTFHTQDKSKGPLTLTQGSSGKWGISSAYGITDYAQTTSAIAGDVLSGFKSAAWSVDGAQTQSAVGVRSGKLLRDKLYGFAQARGIGIAQVYMVDGSHKDIRANAFVAGAGNNSVIGLFDTLFLGSRPSDSYSAGGHASLLHLASGDSVIESTSELVQDVDTDEEEHDVREPRNSAPTKAMGDDEIVSILAHELAHASLKHLEQGMVIQAVTQFMTFGMLGWMAHSPVAAAALALHAPLVHVGACAYDHVIGPPLEGIMKFFTDAHTRHNEYQADEYAARISEKYATALQTSLAKLTVNSNQDPDIPTFYEWLHHDHPTYAKRWAHIEWVKNEAYGASR